MTRTCFVDCEKCGSELKVKIAVTEFTGFSFYRVTDHPSQCRGCTDLTAFPEYPQDVLHAAWAAGEEA